MTEKKCKACGLTKPVDAFSAAPSNADGYRTRCKACRAAERRKRYQTTKATERAQVRRYQRANPDKVLATYLKRAERQGTHEAAQHAVVWALKVQRLTRHSHCQMCGKHGRMQAHHADYTRPLDVIWVCPSCHQYADSRRRVYEGKPAWPNQKEVGA